MWTGFFYICFVILSYVRLEFYDIKNFYSFKIFLKIVDVFIEKSMGFEVR